MSKDDLNIRHLFLLRNEARKELQRFLYFVKDWPGGSDKDFPNRDDFKLKAKVTISERLITSAEETETIDATGGHPPRTFVIPSVIEQRKIDKRAMALKKEFFDLLRSAARGQRPTINQLEALRSTLIEPFGTLSYIPGAKEPYQITSLSYERAAGEHLLKYLNQINACGPVHGICEQQKEDGEDCGVMFILGRGDRKFCPTCSKTRQSYEHRKEYLRKKRMQYYYTEKQENEPYKSKGSHGKTKK